MFIDCEVIDILVICSNRDKKWCPYGMNNCVCNCHEPYELEDEKEVEFSCTDINYRFKNVMHKIIQNSY